MFHVHGLAFMANRDALAAMHLAHKAEQIAEQIKPNALGVVSCMHEKLGVCVTRYFLIVRHNTLHFDAEAKTVYPLSLRNMAVIKWILLRILNTSNNLLHVSFCCFERCSVFFPALSSVRRRTVWLNALANLKSSCFFII